MKKLLSAAVAFCALAISNSALAEVPELVKFVPQAKDFELVYQLDPAKFYADGYIVDNSEKFEGKIVKVGYFMKLVDKNGKTSWAFASFDPFTQELDKIGVPDLGSGTIQQFVNNLSVFGNSVKTGNFEKGNIEFWPFNYGGRNVMKVPNANNSMDFGDEPSKNGTYGSMQVHNFAASETVIAFNNFNSKISDIGIGNCPTGNRDWTFSKSAPNYVSAQLFVVAKFDGLKVSDVKPLDTNKINFIAKTAKFDYAPNEEMSFDFTINFGNQNAPKKPSYFTWTRTGDDGITQKGKSLISPDKPVSIKTKMDKSGFVRIQAYLFNAKGKLYKKTIKGKKMSVAFDGGAGVQIDQIRQAVPEPADFDAFWTKQKQRLAKVPLKYTTTKVSKDGAAIDVFAVSIDCAGPRPATGYLAIPHNAAAKSLPLEVQYHGYGTTIQRPIGGNKNSIVFNVNAHGYDLGKDQAYYDEFFSKIKSNGQIYAFDPIQNADPQAAYFNGMTLRLMRSIQFAKTLPQWNRKDLIISGGSQGGLQTIWAASLDKDVTEARSGITWCCDFAGPSIGRLDGWRPQYVPALGYYDAVNHAKRIKCNTFITRAGLGDYTCPPSGIAALFNNLSAPKKILWVQGSTHGYVPPSPQQWLVGDWK